MNIIFIGTPEFAAVILEELIQHHQVSAVYTRPDAVRNRGQVAESSPVKQVAINYEVPVYTPKSLRDEAVWQQMRDIDPDVICVAAYGALLPKEILEIPRVCCLNVHASLLPAWRGAAPVERAILAGDEETGVCVMRMEEGLDTGDYCVCRTTNVEEKTTEELTDELANLGAHALLTALIHVQNDATDWTRQDDNKATYAEKIGKHELDLKPSDNATMLVRKVQASSATHPARCIIVGRSATVVKLGSLEADAHARELCSGMDVGDALYREKRLFICACDGAVEVLKIKPDGKSLMDARSFAAGIQNIKKAQLTWGSIDA